MSATTVSITAKALAALRCPPEQSDHLFWDADLSGFGLRCRASGARRWVVQYRSKGGVQRRVTLGNPDTVRPDDARKAARDILARVQLGGDPAGERRQAKTERAETMRAVIDAYLARQRERLRPRSFEEVERHLLRGCASIHSKPVDAVSARDVVHLLDRVKAERGAVSGNRVRSSLSACFAWAMRAQRAKINPVIATMKVADEQTRERVLNETELSAIWQATGDGSDYGRIVRLLMLTGARRDEVGRMLWAEISEREGGAITWALPAARAKNNRPLDLLLPPLAAQQLPARRSDEDGALRGFVFGKRGTGYSGYGHSKADLDARLARLRAERGEPAMAPWRLHDLRRSFVTHLNELGVEPHVIEACVNHVSGASRAGVAGVYNRAAYAQPKAKALALWADHVARLAGEATAAPEQVVVLAERRA